MNNSALSRGTPMTLPARVVDQVVDELLQRGHVRRPFIGVAVQPVALPAPRVREHQLTRATALLIMSVAEGSPAERAGLYVGDALVEAEGKPLEHPTDLLDLLSGVGDGASVTLKYLRGGAIRSASLTPADRAAATP
jgi:S1-C subfamily serine protease